MQTAAKICCLVTLFVATGVQADEPGFVPLFNGKDLSGWKVMSEKEVPADQWSVKEGVLSAKTGLTWLRTAKEYENFVLRVEWRVPENGNSGVFVRVPELKEGEQPHVKGIEIQVLDDRGPQFAGKLKEWQYSGSIYGAVPAKNSDYHAGDWNTYEITSRGNELSVVFNGRPVAKANVSEQPELKDRPLKGFIGLQNHGTPVEFRKVEIKVLE